MTIPKYLWQIDEQKWEDEYKKSYFRIAQLSDYTIKADLRKMLLNLSNLFRAILQEEVYCRIKSRQSNLHKRLVRDYIEMMEVINEHIVWGQMMN